MGTVDDACRRCISGLTRTFDALCPSSLVRLFEFGGIKKILKTLIEYGVSSSAILNDPDRRTRNGPERGRHWESMFDDEAIRNDFSRRKIVSIRCWRAKTVHLSTVEQLSPSFFLWASS